MMLRDDLVLGIRLLGGLPRFVRHPVGLTEARVTLRRRLETRGAALLGVARRVYAKPGNPYRLLLESAGCEFGDLERFVLQDGVEGTLESLLARGVYLTVDEFKGRRPVVRGSTSFRIDPVLLQNPAAGGVSALTSGSRGPRRSVAIDLRAIRDWAVNVRFEFEGRGAPNPAVARWSIPGGEAVAGILSMYAGSGVPLARWFSPVDPASPDLHPRYRWSTRLLRWGSVLGGVPVPRPEHVPIEEPEPIIRWITDTLRAGASPFLVMYVSSAVRLARAAVEAGIDLTGSHILGTGEPITASRRATVQRAGMSIAGRYASMEIGPIASGCLTPAAPDDVHVFHDSLALVQPPPDRATAGSPVRPLFISTLQPSVPFTMLNVSLGDQAVLASRTCGCLLGEVGWRTHLHGIRSFEKLTAGGMSFLDADLVRVLEDVLPTRFGGVPTDYQLVEDEEGDGRPRLRLLIHPAVGPVDPTEARAAFLDAIGAGAGPERVMGLAWRGAGFPRVERRPPVATGSGKILHLHVGRQPGGVR
jgi:hypothetical protein